MVHYENCKDRRSPANHEGAIVKSFLYVLLSIALTAVCWGTYGPILRWGGQAMDGSHLLPFICLGIAYFVIAVLAPAVLMRLKGDPGSWTATGIVWSFAAGVAGALGALGVILALNLGGSPLVVMPLVFGCAPVVNTFVTMGMTKSHREVSPIFYAGLILVIVGAVTVLMNKPGTPAPANPPATAASAPIVQLPLVLLFVAMTAFCWGSYGPVLHKGQSYMQGSRLRPFMCVGLAYFVVAVILPFILRAIIDDHGHWTLTGTVWSLAGGTVGALGALGIILAFTFGGKPVYVMPLVFGGAPVVNTFFVMLTSGKEVGTVSPFFYAGLIIVAAGAATVLVFAPKGKPHAPPTKSPETPKVEPAKA
jgi:drug/metabolite transporter (DMT)-like permease